MLPRFDTYLLGYAGRDLVVESAYARRIHPGGGIIHASVLVNGKAVATWKTRRRKSRLEVIVEPFEALPASILPSLEAEAADVGRFLGLEARLSMKDA